MERIIELAAPILALGGGCWLGAAHLVAFRRLRLGRYAVSSALWTLFGGLALGLMLLVHPDLARFLAVPPLLFLALMLSGRPVSGDYAAYASPLAVLLFARPRQAAPTTAPDPAAGLFVPEAAPPAHMPLAGKLLLAAVILMLIGLCVLPSFGFY